MARETAPPFPVRFRSHHDALRGLERVQGGSSRREGASPADVEAFLSREAPGTGRGACVYIHVPYCDKICSFCNLNRSRGDRKQMGEYADYLKAEIRRLGRYPYLQGEEITVVYMGGGTPTLMGEEEFAGVLRALRGHLPLAENCEISVESTLHNLSREKLRALEALGVNRLSIGVQTFDDRGRKMLGRSGGREFCLESLGEIREAFSGILGIDIIYSYPGQSDRALTRDAQDFLSLNLDGVSFYSLMVHEGSELAAKIQKGEVRFDRTLEEDKGRHHRFMDTLEEGGFEILELSKLVRPGRDEYRYIRLRYDNGNVIPLGVGAGGRIGPYSLYNMAPGRQMASPVSEEYDGLHKLLGYFQFGRYEEEAIVNCLGEEKREGVSRLLREYRERGFFRAGDAGNRLSKEGIFWGNNIAVDFLERV